MSIEVSSGRLTRRRVSVRGRLSQPGSGSVRVRVRVRRHGRVRTVSRSTGVTAGRFGVTIVLPRRLRGARTARLRLRYGGDRTFRPARTRDVVGR